MTGQFTPRLHLELITMIKKDRPERGRNVSEPERTRREQGSLRTLLAGLGDVGRDLVNVDWAATPLGPMDGWPQSLQTAVRILATSRFSMWMAWGPELTFLCNDSYRRDTLGKKYPWALGRPAREVWVEIWPDIGPRIESVMTAGEATWDESLLLFLERSGYVEETYHSFPTARSPTTTASWPACSAWSPRRPSGSSASGRWLRCVILARG
jgi:hypothetical protein